MVPKPMIAVRPVAGLLRAKSLQPMTQSDDGEFGFSILVGGMTEVAVDEPSILFPVELGGRSSMMEATHIGMSDEAVQKDILGKPKE